MRKILIWGIKVLMIIVIIIPLCTLLLLDMKRGEVDIETLERPINVFNHETNQLMVMDLEEYIVGVVAAEMPASFELEALKAQAIAARTYAFKRVLEPDQRVKEFHPQAHIVTNPSVSQAWVSPEDLKKKWGLWEYRKYKNKIEKAVKETKGLIITYQGQLIDPVYHASCGGGKTEDSGEVWKYSYPYLTSVQCTQHQDRHIHDTKTIPYKNIDAALGSNLEAIPVSSLKGQTANYIRVLEATRAGRIKTMNIGGQILSGQEVRTKLGLKSTWFKWQINEDSITFTTRGYGHAVGMCQYGANDLAAQGKTFTEILKHYYQGVEIEEI